MFIGLSINPYALFVTCMHRTLVTLGKKTQTKPQKSFRQDDLFPEELCPKPTKCRLYQPSCAKRQDKPPHISILIDKLANTQSRVSILYEWLCDLENSGPPLD